MVSIVQIRDQAIHELRLSSNVALDEMGHHSAKSMSDFLDSRPERMVQFTSYDLKISKDSDSLELIASRISDPLIRIPICFHKGCLGYMYSSTGCVGALTKYIPPLPSSDDENETGQETGPSKPKKKKLSIFSKTEFKLAVSELIAVCKLQADFDMPSSGIITNIQISNYLNQNESRVLETSDYTLTVEDEDSLIIKSKNNNITVYWCTSTGCVRQGYKAGRKKPKCMDHRNFKVDGSETRDDFKAAIQDLCVKVGGPNVPVTTGINRNHWISMLRRVESTFTLTRAPYKYIGNSSTILLIVKGGRFAYKRTKVFPDEVGYFKWNYICFVDGCLGKATSSSYDSSKPSHKQSQLYCKKHMAHGSS